MSTYSCTLIYSFFLSQWGRIEVSREPIELGVCRSNRGLSGRDGRWSQPKKCGEEVKEIEGEGEKMEQGGECICLCMHGPLGDWFASRGTSPHR